MLSVVPTARRASVISFSSFRTGSMLAETHHSSLRIHSRRCLGSCWDSWPSTKSARATPLLLLLLLLTRMKVLELGLSSLGRHRLHTINGNYCFLAHRYMIDTIILAVFHRAGACGFVSSMQPVYHKLNYDQYSTHFELNRSPSSKIQKGQERCSSSTEATKACTTLC